MSLVWSRSSLGVKKLSSVVRRTEQAGNGVERFHLEGLGDSTQKIFDTAK